MLENRALIDSEWGEIEYGVPIPRVRSTWDDGWDWDDEEWTLEDEDDGK